ncbi:MAG: hypothetical protein WCJ26_11915 [bacterium]
MANLKYILFFLLFAATINATHGLYFQTGHSSVQHQPAGESPSQADQPSEFAMDDTSHDMPICHSSLRVLQPDLHNTAMNNFIAAAIPEKTVFSFWRPPEIS